VTAARFDHVAATYAGDKRGTSSFLESDCVVMDIDNDHTNNPDEWITPAALVVRLVLLILRVAGVCACGA